MSSDTPSELIDEIVPSSYEMNPKTDDVVFDGSYLRDGMRVLLESRRNLGFLFSAITPAMKELDRWCVISHVRFTNDKVSFIATYDDGIKVKRTTEISKSWIVKKDSIPVPLEIAEFERKLQQAADKVRDAMGWFNTVDGRSNITASFEVSLQAAVDIANVFGIVVETESDDE